MTRTGGQRSVFDWGCWQEVRVLAVAYALNPYRGGSEGGRAWNWIKQISKTHELWVITASLNKQLIGSGTMHNVHFCFVDNDVCSHLFRLPGVFFEALYYYWWQLKACRVAKKLHEKFCFDIAHHITYGVMRFPSPLAGLGIPFVWGPIGGVQLMPSIFLKALRMGALSEIARLVAIKGARYDPLVRVSMRESKIILVKNRGTLSAIPRKYHYKSKLFPSMGAYPTNIEYSTSPSVCLRLLYVGRLLAWKGMSLLLRSLHAVKQEVPDLEFRLSIVGDGPERPHLVKLTKKLDLESNVILCGKRPHPEVLEMYPETDIFVFPSLREGYGAVVLEAMSFGVPCIVLDCGGPAITVTHESGIKIRPHTPDQVITDFASAIVKLALNPKLRRQLGMQAKRRFNGKFTWDSLGKQMEHVYEEVAEARSNQCT
jgi:glycosyltransferase involved in cell wall biosynthesis